MATAGSSKLVLDASAVVRIIEGSPEALVMQEAVLAADLVLAPELMPSGGCSVQASWKPLACNSASAGQRI